jgi:hypothetical protein
MTGFATFPEMHEIVMGLCVNRYECGLQVRHEVA